MIRAAVLVLLFPLTSIAAAWRPLDPGLELGEFDSPVKSTHGDSRITVLRIDPARASLRLLTASELGENALTAREWARRYRLRAVVNAGMFHAGGDPVGLLRYRGHAANPRLSRDKAVFAFEPLRAKAAGARIIDRECEGDTLLEGAYAGLLQGIRMVDCRRNPRWSRQPKKWSIAALAIDGAGRVLFVHARSPWPVREFIDTLLALPLDVRQAMYLEGGPEASLYVRAGSVERELFGSYETGFYESDANDHAWPLPNVLAVTAP